MISNFFDLSHKPFLLPQYQFQDGHKIYNPLLKLLIVVTSYRQIEYILLGSETRPEALIKSRKKLNRIGSTATYLSINSSRKISAASSVVFGAFLYFFLISVNESKTSKNFNQLAWKI